MKGNEQGKLTKVVEVFAVSAKLGFISFGGPAAHIGYFHEEYVRRRGWLDEKAYADLTALGQFLPGPASSQTGIGVGTMRAGIWGGIAAFVGFTAPSAIFMIIFALLLHSFSLELGGWLHGLKLVAAAAVLHAILGMGQKLAPDVKRKSIALMALVAALLWQAIYAQAFIIVLAGAVSYWMYRGQEITSDPPAKTSPVPSVSAVSKGFAASCLAIFALLLLLLPLLRQIFVSSWLTMTDLYYRAGSLVFGGGHVVLPLLERELLPQQELGREAFLAGYGAAQAMPGPLFTFASYLGTVTDGVVGGIVATAAIFLPAFLLVFGVLPFWDQLRNHHQLQRALMGINAAVVGILGAAFYDPIWTSSVLSLIDFAFGALLFGMLAFWKIPPILVVAVGAAGGGLLTLLPV